MEKFAVCTLLYSITNLLKFSASNFFQVNLFPIISINLKSACVFEYSYAKKLFIFLGSLSTIEQVLESLKNAIRKNWLNQLKKFLQTFVRILFDNFIVGESHRIVKITVPS